MSTEHPAFVVGSKFLEVSRTDSQEEKLGGKWGKGPTETHKNKLNPSGQIGAYLQEQTRTH